MRKFLLPVIAGVLIFGFWLSADFQEIAAGVAIFLFGMLMLEDGFKQYSGGALEKVLQRATGSLWRSLGFGVASTTVMQSSSLVSVIAISFVTAGLITLQAGVGIIFGANIGTTTGAWLVAGFGLKVNISAYAMPLLALGAVLAFQKSKYVRGAGLVMAGLGFLFLGIHYMKEGFDAFSDRFDMTRFALGGVAGLLVYTLIGAVATVVMQSSHATMVLVITALAAGQLTYENALALAIGANIGTTITAIIGSVTANHQGKRLALAHVIFNSATAAVALVLIAPLRDAVDWASATVGIADDDHSLKLAVFHTIFNVLGVVLMVPAMKPLLRLLERAIPPPLLDRSRPRFLSEAVEQFPETITRAMTLEVRHLYENAVELVAHGLNIHRHELFATNDIGGLVRRSGSPLDFDFDERYEQHVKSLYSAILEFATRVTAKDLPPDAAKRIHELREAAGLIVRAVKAIKHMRRNATEYTAHPQGAVTEIYNELRAQVARILVEIRKFDLAEPEQRSGLWFDQELAQIESDANDADRVVEGLLRDRRIDPEAATSFLNDSGYAYTAMRDLMESARAYFADADEAMAEVESILALDDEDVRDLAGPRDAAPSKAPSG